MAGFSTNIISEIVTVAKEAKLDPAALLAVCEVESGGKAFVTVNGKAEPLIRFEGHYFYRLLPVPKRLAARRAGLAASKFGVVKNPRDQAGRWTMLRRAMDIDEAAALQSVSWGIGQVMGSHWKTLGYQSVNALVDEARSSVAGQVRLMLRFIKVNNLAGYIERRDWAGFARRYNGPSYRVNRYDEKMARAHVRHAKALGHGGGDVVDEEPKLLARGARGRAVAEVQRRLVAHGFPVGVDGLFGPATDTALRRFQSAAKLDEDGIAGPKTLAALKAPATEPDATTHRLQKQLSVIEKLLKWIARLTPFWRR